MDNIDQVHAVAHEKSETDAAVALEHSAHERATMPAKEFVSERDALEDAWARSTAQRDRDVGW